MTSSSGLSPSVSNSIPADRRASLLKSCIERVKACQQNKQPLGDWLPQEVALDSDDCPRFVMEAFNLCPPSFQGDLLDNLPLTLLQNPEFCLKLLEAEQADLKGNPFFKAGYTAILWFQNQQKVALAPQFVIEVLKLNEWWYHRGFSSVIQTRNELKHLANNQNFIWDAACLQPEVMKYASPNLRINFGFLSNLAAVRPEILEYVNPDFKQSSDFIGAVNQIRQAKYGPSALPLAVAQPARPQSAF